MVRTKDVIVDDMTLYLSAAKLSIDALDILKGDERRGVEIIHLATAFKQANVMEEADITLSIKPPSPEEDNSS